MTDNSPSTGEQNSMFVSMCIEKAWTSVHSAGVNPEVNLRITQMGKHTRGSTLALKPWANITRSPKQGYQMLHEKDLCPPIF